MMRKFFTEKLRKKAVVGGAVAFMAIAAAVAGTSLLSSKDIENDNSNLVDLNELPDSAQIAEEETKVNTVAGENIQADNFGLDNVMDATDEYIEPEEDTNLLEKSAANETEEQQDTEEKEDIQENKTDVESTTTQSNANVKALNFQAESKMAWPISGNVLVNYSMDSTVYFATLNQYKYNSALIIQGDVNSKVTCAADGVVQEIYTDEETGISMKMDLGNGYNVIYGQLKEVQVKEGDTVAKGSLIGYISEPTKYYSIEGSNLYFKLTKDDAPVNPLNFLE
ncbi:M23 family metallopeptidase [Konateibacter massiliensis]|uniref:M23 family metallopeptidase n=1 Tax=Konateibacter massiliensis TaxID=2002841 RepID=UPI001F44C5D7|nr:M23 family metallopeptidase [Konateibacter massiliensis]